MAHMAGTPEKVDQVVRDIRTVMSSVAAIGNTTLVNAPGQNNRIVVSIIHVGAEGGANTVRLLNGNTAQRGFFMSAAGAHEERVFPSGCEWRLSNNAALVIQLAQANSVNYEIDYWIEDAG